jgi:hypothetical protein
MPAITDGRLPERAAGALAPCSSVVICVHLWWTFFGSIRRAKEE